MLPLSVGREVSNPNSVVSAMGKIASHIDTAKKFSKASKLALQLLEAGSVNRENGGAFFQILEGAMKIPGNSGEPGLREDYKALFTAAEERKDVSKRVTPAEWFFEEKSFKSSVIDYIQALVR